MTMIGLLKVQCHSEKLEEMKATLIKVLAETINFDGYVSILVFANQDNPLNLILVEQWQSRRHMEINLS